MIEKIISAMSTIRRIPNHKLLDSIDTSTQQVFQAEAKGILQTRFFHWFLEDTELATHRMMFKGTREALLVGKGMLYALELMKRNMEIMAHSRLPLKDTKEKKNMVQF